jgi:hypothetical protein
MNRPGDSADLVCLRLQPRGALGVHRSSQFVFCGCQVMAVTAQPAVVVPVDPFQGGKFDVVETSPRTAVVDQFGLERLIMLLIS